MSGRSTRSVDRDNGVEAVSRKGIPLRASENNQFRSVAKATRSVGLDVHARSVVACGLDRQTGELFERRLTPNHQEILEWIGSLPSPMVLDALRSRCRRPY
jgi:hypothetical protein